MQKMGWGGIDWGQLGKCEYKRAEQHRGLKKMEAKRAGEAGTEKGK